LTCSAADAAGNEATGSFDVTVRDTTAPNNVAVVGAIDAGDSFLFGDVPPKPTCTAEDAVGVVSCVVGGYATTVGTHTLTATATYGAGNEGKSEISYEVEAWTIKGYYGPVAMPGTNSVDTAKAGSPVPLKLEVSKGTTGLTDTSANVVKAFTQKITCPTTGPTDAIEKYSSGKTVLRYNLDPERPAYPGAREHRACPRPAGQGLVAFARGGGHVLSRVLHHEALVGVQ